MRPAAATRLFRFYKPPATLTAAHDPKGRPTIYDRLPAGPAAGDAGRPARFHDRGPAAAHQRRRVEAPARAAAAPASSAPTAPRAFGPVTQAQLEELAEGITIEGIHYGSINANLERRTGRNCWIEMSLTEGKNREVRRVLEHLGTAGLAADPHRLRAADPRRARARRRRRSRTGRARRVPQDASNEDHRRRLARADDRSAAGPRDPPDRRPRSRNLVLDARQPPRQLSRICGSPTCSPAAARSASKLCRAARPRPPSSRATRRRRRSSAAMPRSSARPIQIADRLGLALPPVRRRST